MEQQNSFAISGTQTELFLFTKEVGKIGWVKYINEVHDSEATGIIFRGKENRFFNVEFIYSHEPISISSPHGWQQALNLAIGKQEKIITSEKPILNTENKMTIRQRFAMSAMQGLCANQIAWSECTIQDFASQACKHADALINELNKTDK